MSRSNQKLFAHFRNPLHFSNAILQPPKQNPEMIEAERRYKAILEESEREKQRNRSTGLAGLLGLE